MGLAWIEDRERPGGIGRGERERVFWERVASGRRPARARDEEVEGGSVWESAELAIVTLLTVVIFGLGWVTVELEGRSHLESSPDPGIGSGYDGTATTTAATTVTDPWPRPTTTRGDRGE